MTDLNDTERALKSLSEFAFSTFFTTLLRFLVRIGKNVVFTRLLGPYGRGIYGLFITIPDLIVSFGNLGFGLGSLYLISKKKYDLNKILGNALLYILIQGTVLMCIGLALLTFKDILRDGEGIIEQLGIFMIIAIPLWLSFEIGLYLLTGIKDIHFMNILMLLFSFFPIILLILFWFLNGNALQSAVYAWIGSVFIVSVMAFLRVYHKGGKGLSLSMRYIKEAFSFGVRGNVSIFANIVVRRIDILFIAYYLGAEAVGYYAVSVSIAEILLALPDSIAAPFLPIRLELDENTAQGFSPVVIKVTLISMILLCGLTALFGKIIIMILYGTEFIPALSSLLWLLPGILALSIYQFLKADIYSLNRPGFISWISVLTMFSNILLNFLMIPRYGIIGAAISSSISYTLSTLVLLLFFLNKTGLTPLGVLLVKKDDFRFFSNQIKSIILRVQS